MKKGFTLIELAIVLVIISIVIGAIIGSRDLIESAKLNGIISDFKKYESAFNAFKEKYGALPGDMPDASEVFTPPDSSCNVYNGDGSGTIDRASAMASQNAGSYETQMAMDMLSKAGFIDFKADQSSLSCQNISNFLPQIGIRYPESSIKKAGYYFYYSKVGFNPPIIQGNHLYLGASSELHNYPLDGVLTPNEALSLDKRMDDGQPGTGKFSGYYSLTEPRNCVVNEGYNIEEKKKVCTLVYFVEQQNNPIIN